MECGILLSILMMTRSFNTRYPIDSIKKLNIELSSSVDIALSFIFRWDHPMDSFGLIRLYFMIEYVLIMQLCLWNFLYKFITENGQQKFKFSQVEWIVIRSPGIEYKFW